MPKNKATNITSGKSKRIPDFTVSEWNGLNTVIKDITELKDGESPDSLNWMTSKYKDHIEIRRGYALLGTTRQSGPGRVTGLSVGMKMDATQIPFYTYGQKLNYYNSTDGDTHEISTNVLPSIANGEDVSLMPYQNLAGAFMYFTSPDSSIYKVATSNPDTVTDLKSTAFRGKAKIDTNRMFLWDRRDVLLSKYQTELYLSVSDKTDISQYTQTTKESIGTGDGTTLTFSNTLAFKAANSKATAFFVEIGAPIAGGTSITGITAASQAVVTAPGHTLAVGDVAFIDGVIGMTEINNLYGAVMAITATTVTLSINSSTFTAYSSGGNIYKAEYFYDDKNGNLTSNLGGTGSINYSSGAVSVTFVNPPDSGKGIYAQYYTEDATSGGVADFTIDGATTGKGKIFPQFDGGGAIQGVFPFDQTQYCFHILKTWYLTLGQDDTKAANLPYRSNFGIPYWRGGYPTPDGILVLDNSQSASPKIKILQVDSTASTSVISVVPISISDSLDLSFFGFSQVVIWRFGEFDIAACQNVTNGVVDNVNTVFFVRNTYSKQWDKLDYAVSCLGEYYGSLISGDSLSNNVYTLFSGFDDDGSTTNNYWLSKQFNLRLEGIKRFNYFVLRGLIQQTQNIDVYFAFDSGSFVKVFTVSGTGPYVNTGNPIVIGSNTIGSQVVGGGSGQGAPVSAYPFEVEFEFATDYFEYVQVKYVANNIGFVQIDTFTFKDIRYKGKRLPASRIVSPI